LAQSSSQSSAQPVDNQTTQPGSAVEYDETASGLVARIGGHVVGVAAFAMTEGRELTIEVAPAWRRLGIGTQLLTRAASQAAADGADEIVLLAPREDEGFVTMVCGAGLRARIKVSDGVLQARIVVTGIHRSSARTAVVREDRATPAG
jgi:GNAT superfamily N-acetyltransferase